MAVPKSKKSRSMRDHRRAHTKSVHTCVFSEDPTTGERHRRHHVTDMGYYRGKELIKKNKEENSE